MNIEIDNKICDQSSCKINKMYFQIYYLEIADDLTNLFVYHGYVNITYGYRRCNRRRINNNKKKKQLAYSARKTISRNCGRIARTSQNSKLTNHRFPFFGSKEIRVKSNTTPVECTLARPTRNDDYGETVRAWVPADGLYTEYRPKLATGWTV